MKANRFAELRRRRRVPAYRGRTVLYQGRRYRVAGLAGGSDGLVLKSRILVHPTDPALNYDAKEDGIERLRRLVKDERRSYQSRMALEGGREVKTRQSFFLVGLEKALRLVTGEGRE